MKITKSNLNAANAIIAQMDAAGGDVDPDVFAELIARELQAERKAATRIADCLQSDTWREHATRHDRGNSFGLCTDLYCKDRRNLIAAWRETQKEAE